jgi:hypothetical protein
MTDRSDLILAHVSDLIANFLYYDRKWDEDLPLGEIEAAIEAGEITEEEIVAEFALELKVGLQGK